jgi:succinyl-CoA synthetase alpha subunit
VNLSGDESVLVQGITGRQGSFWTERMLECGTRIVAGVTPGKGGRQVHGIPVFDGVAEAAAEHQLDMTVLFIPPLAAKAACMDAFAAGIRKVVLLTEHIPAHDTMEILAEARAAGAQVLGPNTAGAVMPGSSSVGIMPGFAPTIFRPGGVGVISRSGSLGTLICHYVVRAGFGQSVFLGIGGDPMLGTTILDALRVLEGDPRTEVAVLVGEVGGTMEEAAAGFIAQMETPVVAFVAGRTAPPGRRMGHAGAIVTGSRGDGESKVRELRGAGARVLDVPSKLPDALRELATAGTPQPGEASMR